MLIIHYEISEFNGLKYVIRYHDGYTKGKKYPVILFLHGAGSRGEDINELLNNPFFTITKNYKDFPFIIVAPQCNKNNWFEVMSELQNFATEIINFDFTDAEKMYAIGASMGGYAVWQLAMNRPKTFAAIIPICGGGMYWNAERLTGTAIWAFHGENDNVVYPEESVKMVEKINSTGGNALLTVYKNTEHDSWTETYSNYKVFEWLLDHRNTYSNKNEDKFNNSKNYG